MKTKTTRHISRVLCELRLCHVMSFYSHSSNINKKYFKNIDPFFEFPIDLQFYSIDFMCDEYSYLNLIWKFLYLSSHHFLRISHIWTNIWIACVRQTSFVFDGERWTNSDSKVSDLLCFFVYCSFFVCFFLRPLVVMQQAGRYYVSVLLSWLVAAIFCWVRAQAIKHWTHLQNLVPHSTAEECVGVGDLWTICDRTIFGPVP